jgi:hypothetical protein
MTFEQKDFLDIIPKRQATRAKLYTWDYIKLKGFRTVKETINKSLQAIFLVIIFYISK